MRNSRIASRCCSLASRYCRIAGVADADICLKSIACVCWLWTRRRAGSVALVDDGRIVREREGDASRTHGERLPGELAALGAPFAVGRRVCRRRRARVVHRPAHRHRDDAGAGAGERAADRRRLRARGARAAGEPGARRRRARRLLDRRAARRGVLGALPRGRGAAVHARAARRARSAGGRRPAAHARGVVAAIRVQSAIFAGDGAVRYESVLRPRRRSERVWPRRCRLPARSAAWRPCARRAGWPCRRNPSPRSTSGGPTPSCTGTASRAAGERRWPAASSSR